MQFLFLFVFFTIFLMKEYLKYEEVMDMLKKIITLLILVPIILILAIWIVDLGIAIISGEMDLISWLRGNRVIFAVIITYLIFRYANPFKKDSGE